MSDWSNRRKELKFAATDLKLARRKQETAIQHWDVWRQDAPPKCFFLWAARLDHSKRDTVEKMADEAQSVVNTYSTERVYSHGRKTIQGRAMSLPRCRPARVFPIWTTFSTNREQIQRLPETMAKLPLRLTQLPVLRLASEATASAIAGAWSCAG